MRILNCGAFRHRRQHPKVLLVREHLGLRGLPIHPACIYGRGLVLVFVNRRWIVFQGVGHGISRIGKRESASGADRGLGLGVEVEKTRSRQKFGQTIAG